MPHSSHVLEIDDSQGPLFSLSSDKAYSTLLTSLIRLMDSLTCLYNSSSPLPFLRYPSLMNILPLEIA